MVAVVVVKSPQTPEDDPEKRLRRRWETGKCINGNAKAQPLAVRGKGGVVESLQTPRDDQEKCLCPNLEADKFIVGPTEGQSLAIVGGVTEPPQVVI